MAFHTIHNYIDTKEMILRKGAIAAHEGEKVLIPINMRDGSILAVGKGNPEWNYSAPHRAGRIMSRRKAKKDLKLDDYIKAMEGIYTTSVNENTLDEAPMVYELTESGCWSHNHMNPLYLQLEEPEHIPGDEENQTFISAMKAFGNYLQSEDEEKVMKGQAVIQTAREYAEIKRCKEWQTRNLNEAMKPEDIMF